MHDGIFDRDAPVDRRALLDIARAIGLEVDRFARDLDSEEVRARVEQDMADGRRNGVTGTPTLFVDGVRYDGAWDFHSMLEQLERPFAARVDRSARVFASLPTSAGLVLLVAAVLALACANTVIAPLYDRVMNGEFVVGPAGSPLSLPLREWLSEGLLSLFFLLVGLEIRRETTRGALADWRAAMLPVFAAIGGVVAPALIYLALSPVNVARGWAVPTATDIAFTLALLALLGDRVPAALRVFVAALAVVDDLLSVLILSIFYPRSFAPQYGIAVVAALVAVGALNRARVYAIWAYAAAGIALWISLHALGVPAALAGVLLALGLPTRPAPAVAPLLAQAATALAALEDEGRDLGASGASTATERGERAQKERLEQDPVWEWAGRNLSAATRRLASPADRIERAVAPWSAYFILPAFAFSSTGVTVTMDFSSHGAPRAFAAIVVALVLGKPLGVLAASGAAVATRLAIAPEGVTKRQFFGAACLCGVGDTVALLVADRALAPTDAAVAKLAVLAGSAIAGALGTLVLRERAVASTPSTS
jgi:NhaA family Na+:H+ antiporter